nr:glycosyltransferase family 1 protein [Pseudopedobacter sp.]
MNHHLHIVSFDIPFPANYGGVIDVFYKLKALWEEGVQITLHCFKYGNRLPAPELEKYCNKVYYYKRKRWANPFQNLPYIVVTRNDAALLKNLLMDDAPILFEALHSCYFLDHPKLINRKKIVRMHNIEHDYYRLLAEAENNGLKKAYYKFESVLLLKYENILSKADVLLTISPNDFIQLSAVFKRNCFYLPAFHANKEVTSKTGQGHYCFYHGKLSVAENNQAALFLVQQVFSKLSVPFIIAGDGVSKELKTAASIYANVEIKEGLNSLEIDELIANAHINVLSTFQPTGIKLKLLNVLYKGRFVLTNPAMVDNTGLAELCEVTSKADEFISLIPKMMQMEFIQDEIDKREIILNSKFNVSAQAKLLKGLI